LQATKVSLNKLLTNTEITAAEIALPIWYNLLIISVEKRGGAFSICLFPIASVLASYFFSWNQIYRQHNRKIA
jgi:hypothetical protein